MLVYNEVDCTCMLPQIVTESVKPWSMDPANLKDEANRFLYPPSFKVEVRGSGNRTSQDEIVMNFSGNTETPLPDIGFYLPGSIGCVMTDIDAYDCLRE